MDISRAVSREPHPQPHRVILRAVDCRRGWFAVHSQPRLPPVLARITQALRFDAAAQHRSCSRLVFGRVLHYLSASRRAGVKDVLGILRVDADVRTSLCRVHSLAR